MTGTNDDPPVTAGVFSHELVSGERSPAIRLAGELDITTIGAMADALRSLHRDATPIVVDLAGLDFACGRGTHALAAEIAALRAARPVTVANLPSRVQRVATLLFLTDDLGSST